MATPVIIVLAIVAMVTFVAIAAVVSQLVARLRRLMADLTDIQENLMPAIERLQVDAEVTGRELERLGHALEDSAGQTDPRTDLVMDADGPIDSTPYNGPVAGPDLSRQEQP